MHAHLPFRTTRWSLVVASRTDAPEGRKALDELCEAYWYPLYVYLRRAGTDDAEARDRVQEFIADALEGGAAGGQFDGADPERGSFRSYMMGAIRHHAANGRRAENALRRGGGRVTSLDLTDPGHAAAERFGRSTHTRTPEQEFERAWALELIERAMAMLGAEYTQRGRQAVFEALRDTLDGSGGSRTHAERADALGCSVGAVKVNAHRLRQRMGDLLREEVRQTVAPEIGLADGATGQAPCGAIEVGIQELVDAELRHLVAILGGRFGDSL